MHRNNKSEELLLQMKFRARERSYFSELLQILYFEIFELINFTQKFQKTLWRSKLNCTVHILGLKIFHNFCAQVLQQDSIPLVMQHKTMQKI